MFKRRKEKTRDHDEEKEHIVAKVWYVEKKQEIQKIQGRKNGKDKAEGIEKRQGKRYTKETRQKEYKRGKVKGI